MWWSGGQRVASKRTKQLGAKESEVSRLAVRAVGAGTRDCEVRSVSERRGRDDKGNDNDNDNDEVARDEAI